MIKPLFSIDDPLGHNSNLVVNYWRYDEKKNHQFMRDHKFSVSPRWGSDKDIAKAKILPRGKAYDRLWTICCKRELNTPHNY